ncbi:MAG TPA: hypothetical protein VFG67_00040 [Oleiagrimonas sp.]|nr:hypothetical protein [Oleiagrimonas sp.]
MRIALVCILSAPAAFAFGQNATQAPITSRAQLNLYLQTVPLGRSPLDLLSPGGRKRFLAQLEFGQHGLARASIADPAHELTHPQVVALFSLFDVEKYAQGLGLAPAERARRQHERVAAAKARGCKVDTCPESAIEKAFDQLILNAHPGSSSLPERAAAIAHAYDRLFTRHQEPSSLPHVDAPDLRLLKRAAENVLFYAPDATRIDQLRNDLAEMHKRGMTTDESYTKLYRALVATRQFRQARRLAQNHPGLSVATLPAFREPARLPPGQPTALSLGDDGNSMTRQAFDLDTPLRIVIVASCHFSKDAARAIKQDPQLQPLFAGHAIWLADQSEPIANVEDWNREFPDQPIHVAWQNSEWSKLDSWGMPTFYIFRHGKLVDQWHGWPADTGMQTLRRHLRDDGIRELRADK